MCNLICSVGPGQISSKFMGLKTWIKVSYFDQFPILQWESKKSWPWIKPQPTLYWPQPPPHPCPHTDLVWQDDSRASTDAHDGHGRLSGNEVQDLCHSLRANVVLEHHAMNTVGGEGVTDAGEQRPWVGVVDQHSDGVHLQGQVHEVFPA